MDCDICSRNKVCNLSWKNEKENCGFVWKDNEVAEEINVNKLKQFIKDKYSGEDNISLDNILDTIDTFVNSYSAFTTIK